MEYRYITYAELLVLHERQIMLFGGSPGVRDEGLLRSALDRPKGGYYADLIEEAAALWESLAMNHGFVDGNKRIAFAATHAFLGVNGVRVKAGQMAIAEVTLSNMTAGTFRKDVLEDWLHKHTEPR